MCAWLALMTPLARWGLPSRQNDDLLFGGRPAWSAAEFRAAESLLERGTREAGADTDLNPIRDRTRPVDLTSTDSGRAEILRRYRLFSRQPDEMITFMALQRMNPRKLDFDPKLYQYGGAYIYLVGALEASAALVGFTRITSDVGVYLDQPDLFARFYFVSRLLTLSFGVLALLAVYRLARRIGGRGAGWVAVILVMASPVFITAALEAKPHLPSVALVLWATDFAVRFASSARPRDVLRLGLTAGAAAAMVLTGLAAAWLWAALAIARRSRRAGGPLVRSAALAVLVFLAANPFLLLGALSSRSAAASNLGNSMAMYAEQLTRAGEGALRVAELLMVAGGLPVAFGLLATVLLARRRPRQALLIGVAPLAMLLLCVFLAAGKPAEFARFLLLPTIALMIALGGALGLAAAPGAARAPVARQALVALALIACVATSGATACLRSFWIDAGAVHESRRRAALFLKERAGGEPIAVVQEPAPYSIPPLNFAGRRVVLLPLRECSEPSELPRWLVMIADDLPATDGWWSSHYELRATFPPALHRWSISPIGWANKPVFVFERRGVRREPESRPR